jgi:hypothetical protein
MGTIESTFEVPWNFAFPFDSFNHASRLAYASIGKDPTHQKQ